MTTQVHVTELENAYFHLMKVLNLVLQGLNKFYKPSLPSEKLFFYLSFYEPLPLTTDDTYLGGSCLKKKSVLPNVLFLVSLK